jgi:hypothetical protein
LVAGRFKECVKKWLDRYAAQGEPGLHERSYKPHTMPRRTPMDVEQRIVELRRRERRGPD